VTNQPPYQPPQYPHQQPPYQQPQYQQPVPPQPVPQQHDLPPAEDPFTEPPTPPPYGGLDPTMDAYHQQAAYQPQPAYQEQQHYQQYPAPPQQYQQQQPYAPPFNPAFIPPPPSAPKRRVVWPWIAAGVAGVVLVGCAVLYNGYRTTKAVVNGLPFPTKGTAAAGVVGQPVQDGGFTFLVRSMDCGKKTIGTPTSEYDSSRRAKDEFCIIDLGVRNTGSTTESFSISSQDVFGPSGVSLNDDILAEDALARDEGKKFALFVQIAPGGSLDTKLVFDTPPTQRPDRIVLHQGYSSGGISIPLH
jgi:hypothetical protein